MDKGLEKSNYAFSQAGVLTVMLTQKSISLITMSILLIITTGIAHADNIETKTGDVQVLTTERTVNLPSPTRRQPPSLLQRLRIWRPHNFRVSSPPVSSNCRTVNSSYQSTRTSKSGNGVVRSSSSSSSTVCN
ncbi:MAG: hypothetical protein HC930_18150 [Hydrococcus sp. SU_1_0]|nr:hypothetical protein [Hydrococcus sp. SU_1_0]